MTLTLIFTLLGYLSGSVLYARVVSALLHKDGVLEQSADGNPGTANALMQGGLLCGLLTLLGDLLKGFLPVFLYFHAPESLGPEAWPAAFVVAAPVIGHIFPIFYRFEGGKGIAVSFGCLLGLLPAWQPLVVFALAFLLLSLVFRVTPHFYRSIAAYLTALLGMGAVYRPLAPRLGFFLITLAVCLRFHRSKEPRESMRIRLLWMP